MDLAALDRRVAPEARRLSCKAPATISEAEAEPPLMSTMTGLPLVRSPGRALKRWVSSGSRPRVETISPRRVDLLTRLIYGAIGRLGMTARSRF
jgi:hypothetical protein